MPAAMTAGNAFCRSTFVRLSTVKNVSVRKREDHALGAERDEDRVARERAADRHAGIASAITASGVAGRARQFAGHAPVAHDHDAVGHPEELGQVGRDHQDREALGREAVHEA